MNWKLEGSNNQSNWELIDKRQKETRLNGDYSIAIFHIQHQELYSNFKLTQTGRTNEIQIIFNFHI